MDLPSVLRQGAITPWRRTYIFSHYFSRYKFELRLPFSRQRRSLEISSALHRSFSARLTVERDILPKGQFVVMKTGTHPMQTRLRLFLDWGISFGDPYLLPERAARTVAYANKQELEQAIFRCHHAQPAESDTPPAVRIPGQHLPSLSAWSFRYIYTALARWFRSD